jgi:hypothetical protein
MRRLSSDLAGHRPIELDSEETVDYLGRKRRAIKGMAISDDAGDVRHNSVVCCSSEETIDSL